MPKVLEVGTILLRKVWPMPLVPVGFWPVRMMIESTPIEMELSVRLKELPLTPKTALSATVVVPV